MKRKLIISYFLQLTPVIKFVLSIAMIELHDLSSDESFDGMTSSDISCSSPKTGAASNKSSSNSTVYDSPRVSDIILVRAAAYHGINQL
ncbi:unnamed protein product [Adineta ricciae]|uniref:Uncharacterized protein n=1 Tax=Adineta ricciae TaxID=249248 RepID=A0A815WGM4_ADIRI|nr:unnamed protein product [Adineta ricciae]